MSITVGGYYDAATSANAKMTHMVGDGGAKPETLNVNLNTVGGSNPFSGAEGSAWDNPTYSVPGTVLDSGVPTSLTFPSTNIDCLSWAGVLLRTDVQDTDADGIPDNVEDGIAIVPDGAPALPDFPALGASKTVPDLFVELGFLQTSGWPAGSGVGAHDHRPSANALALVGRAFKRAGINAHFDVGSNGYPAALNPLAGNCTTATNWTLGCAIVPAGQARGGEFVTETACGSVSTAPCQFPAHPGTVGWKSGYQYYRDAPVAANGTQLTASEESAWDESCEASGVCPPRRRFDANRMDFFHYSLWAHALGLPKASCLNPDGSADTACQATNPDFHVPVRSSGFGDVGGGDSLITLGGFGFVFGDTYSPNGSDIAQAGTFMHELGHNFERRHGGEPLERNCKPNYISVMSYLFQVHGMNAGTDVDFSGQTLSALDEGVVTDGPMAGAAYAPRWYAPLATSYIQNSLNVNPASKHCDGSMVNTTTEAPMVRVDAISATSAIDWLNDGNLTNANQFFDTVSGQTRFSDINFDGNHNPMSPTASAPDGKLNGSNDWFVIKDRGLRQMASRPNMGLTSLEMSVADLGRGDPGRGDPGRGDPGRGDPGRGDPGRGDPGRGDPGRGDPGRGDPGAPPDQGDLPLEHANAIFNGPYALTATKVAKTVVLRWLPPHVTLPGVTITSTTAWRVLGTAITPANWAKRENVGTVMGETLTIVDAKPLSNKDATYVVVVTFSDAKVSGISNTVTIRYP